MAVEALAAIGERPDLSGAVLHVRFRLDRLWHRPESLVNTKTAGTSEDATGGQSHAISIRSYGSTSVAGRESDRVNLEVDQRGQLLDVAAVQVRRMRIE